MPDDETVRKKGRIGAGADLMGDLLATVEVAKKGKRRGKVHKTPLRIKGKPFPSVVAAAEHFGVPKHVVYYRLQRGATPEEAFLPSGRAKPRRNGLVYQGQPFDTIGALAKHLGVNRSTLTNKLRLRKSDYSALTAWDVREPPSTVIVVQGVPYHSKTAAAEAYGLYSILVNKRLEKGWTEREAYGIDPPPIQESVWAKARLRGEKHVHVAPPGGYKLYEIKNLKTGRFYIGITAKALRERLRGHISGAPKSRTRLARAIQKYGAKNFEIKLIRNDATSYRELQEQEIAEIAARDAIKLGYNNALGGAVGNSTAIAITVAGQGFESQALAAAYYDVPGQAFNRRLAHGWTPEQAAGIAPPPPDAVMRIPIEVEGKSYPNIRAAAKAYGLRGGLVYNRLAEWGWSIREALELDQRTETRGVPKPITALGVPYDNLKQCAKAHNILLATLRAAIARGVDLDAYLKAHQQPKVWAVIEGVTYRTLSEAVRAYNQSFNLVSKRLASGWSQVDALRTPSQKNPGQRGKPVHAFGQDYPSLTACAEAHGVPYMRLHDNISRYKKSLEDAIRFIQAKKK
jgi:hypothetical protein